MVWNRNRLVALVVIVAQTDMTAFASHNLITNSFKRLNGLAPRNNRQFGHLARDDHGSNQGLRGIWHWLSQF